jgi:peptide/nickel transport system permease protein
LLPGNIAQSQLGMNASAEALAQLERSYGLDKPVLSQFGSWIGSAIQGDLGTSMLTGANISQEIADKATVTLPLIALASIIALIISVPLGMLAALRQKKLDGLVLSTTSQLGIAIPTFWMGVMLISLFALRTSLFPAGGFPDAGWQEFGESLRSLLLPAITLGLAQGAVLARFARSATLETMQQDYFRTARATGLTRSQALRIHGLRNALIPVISVLGVQISTLIVGAIVVENVFALPGIGQMLLQDVAIRDYPKVQGIVVCATAMVFIVGFAIDFIMAAIDPRSRRAS